MKYTICAIIKNERRYLDEWIRHCLSIGFDAIHLYEDYGSDTHKDIVDKYKRVFLHSYSEVEVTDYSRVDKKQIDLFYHFIKAYGSQYDWCAFIDPDEYLRFEDGWSLERLCSEFHEYSGVMLRQKTYGANGNIKRPNGGLQENYTVNPQEYSFKWSMKTIVNLHEEIEFKGVHRTRGAVFTDGSNRIDDAFCYDKAWYDHYYTKSYEDWCERFTTRGDVVPNNVKFDTFYQFNKDMMEFRKGIVSRHLKEGERGKLVIIGNKPLDKDYTSLLDDFNMVVRVNRMTNYDFCRHYTDLWLCDVFADCRNDYKKEWQGKFRNVGHKITFSHNKKETEEYFGESVDSVDFCSIPITKYIPNFKGFERCRITNTVWMIIYCLEHYAKDYDIYILGVDVEDRSFLADQRFHCWIWKEESEFLLNYVNNGMLNIVTEELHKCYATTEQIIEQHDIIQLFPRVSSFWHSDSDCLPKMVVSSISSFLHAGYEYNLYVYKTYCNIPKGVRVHDANDILPEKSLFMDCRGTYAIFSDLFRIHLVNKVDTAWTDTDNFLISDSFGSQCVLMEQDGMIQNSFFYLGNDEKSVTFKRMLLDFVSDDGSYCSLPINLRCKKAELHNVGFKDSEWGVLGSVLFTEISKAIEYGNAYDYYRDFCGYHYSEQYKLYTEPYNVCIYERMKNVKVLCLSMNLLQRCPWILKNMVDNSFASLLFNKYI